ncbi:MAG: alkaline phosphatase D family protein [Acidimicrobiia bacterium]
MTAVDRRRFVVGAGALGVGVAAAPLVRLLPATPARASELHDPSLAPFFHGVASFDPTPSAVLLWTRVTPPAGKDAVPLKLRVAKTIEALRTARPVSLVAKPEHDFTVTFDATGLEPFTYYYYEFEAPSLGGARSIVGRTKTAPASGQPVDRLRIAVASCSNYEAGFFNAYGRMAERNDLDLVVHVGDYVYEYANGKYVSGKGEPLRNPDGSPRFHEPAGEMVALGDYRLRYASYRTDPELMRVHQLFPMVHTWDDHESTNDSWRDGASNHQPDTEGSWADRKQAFSQACQEWLPKRLPTGDPLKIYRTLPYGDLVDLIVMDTRIDGRDEQVPSTEVPGVPVPATLDKPATNDPQRSLISEAQRRFVYDALSTSQAAWKVLAQQVMVMQFNAGGLPRLDLLAQMGGADGPSLTAAGLREGGNAFNSDAWDGYTAERDRLFDHVLDHGIEDVVVLTGDIHTSWAADLTKDPYDPAVYDPTGVNPLVRNVGVEFVTPSITSQNFDVIAYQASEPFGGPADPAFLQLVASMEAAIIAGNPHIRMAEIVSHGYNVLDVTAERVQSDWYFVDTVLEPSTEERFHRGYTVARGEHVVRPALGEAADPNRSGPPVPAARPVRA